MAVAIAVLDTAVISPLALTVKLGTVLALPKAPTFELTVANVNAADISTEPLTEDNVAVPSPVKLRSLGVDHTLELEALPTKLPYTVVTFRFLFKLV